MFSRLSSALALALALGVGLGACDDSLGPSTNDAQLSVALTDAPSEYFASATVDIGAIEIIPASGPPIELTSSGGEHDLLDLQNGVMADLATLDIESGTYLQLRLIVESASVELAEGYEFADGSTSKSLFVPSGAQTGIKLDLSSADGDEGAGVEIAPGETILMVVDMDVSQNFVFQGDPDSPEGIQGVLFTPLLRVVLDDVAGTISGTVTSDADGSGLENETVRAVLLSSEVLEALQTDEATAITGSDGSYTIHFLSPGEYEVSVDEFSADSQTVTVGEDEDVTGIDFVGSSTSTSGS